MNLNDTRMTINELKAQLQNAIGAGLAESVQLAHAGKVLKNGRQTLLQAGLTNFCQVFVLATKPSHLPGGMIKSSEQSDEI